MQMRIELQSDDEEIRCQECARWLMDEGGHDYPRNCQTGEEDLKRRAKEVSQVTEKRVQPMRQNLAYLSHAMLGTMLTASPCKGNQGLPTKR